MVWFCNYGKTSLTKIRISRAQKQILFAFCRGEVSKAKPKIAIFVEIIPPNRPDCRVFFEKSRFAASRGGGVPQRCLRPHGRGPTECASLAARSRRVRRKRLLTKSVAQRPAVRSSFGRRTCHKRNRCRRDRWAAINKAERAAAWGGEAEARNSRPESPLRACAPQPAARFRNFES